MLVVAVGLAREARIAAAPDAKIVIGACDVSRLREQATAAADAGAKAFLSFGVAGALSPMLRTGDCVIASAVHIGQRHVHADERWTAAIKERLPATLTAPILGMDAIIDSAREKRRQFARTGAAAVDTESHVVAAIAAERGLPFAAIRVITDTAVVNLPPAALDAIGPDGKPKFWRVLGSVLLSPGQIPLLMRTGSDARAAFRVLSRCRQRLGPAFAADWQ
jgi:hopanoid-associated phosphorylase